MALVGFDDLARFILVHQPSASICPVLDCKKAVNSDQAGFQPDWEGRKSCRGKLTRRLRKFMMQAEFDKPSDVVKGFKEYP